MHFKNEEIFHTILRIIVLVSIVASIALLLQKGQFSSDVAFDLLAYIISFTALALTTLQSISIARQVRLTRYSTSKVSQSINQLDELIKVNQQLARVIEHDTELDQQIVAALSSHDIGRDKAHRAQIAKTVRQNVTRHLKAR